MKKKNGNILVTFIIIATLALVAFSLFFVVSGRLKSSTGESNYIKALYVAEAGVHKAIWNLVTPPAEGGQGTSWRATGLTEDFGDGRYTMVVTNGREPGNVLITSSGEVADVVRTVQVEITSSKLPAAFDYALYNNGNLTVKGSVTISGDIFANGNMTIQHPASIPTGEVFVPEGNTIGGSGTYTVGGYLPDPPQMPYLDTSYYEGEIGSARLRAPGDLTLNNYDLTEDLYVNGNVSISGTLTGSGKIVSSGTMSFSTSSTSPNITYISGSTLSISGNSSVNGSIVYASQKIDISGTPRVQGTLLSSSIVVAGTPSVFGVIYSWNLGVTLGTANIYGCLINPTNQTYTGNISITYDPSYLPSSPPPGMTSGGYRILPGSWKEL